MSKNTGGPAFPFVRDADFDYGTGMTLRDYFAAKAMQILVHSMGNQGTIHIFNDVQAEVAYQMADQMLKAREA
jgi:hypothetical protein